jgi:putative DNA primase/helicase
VSEGYDEEFARLELEAAIAAGPGGAGREASEGDWSEVEALGRPDEPMLGARALERRAYTGPEGLAVRRYWRGSFYAHTGAYWRELPDADVNAELYKVAEHACYLHVGAKGVTTIKPWAPTTPKITNLRNAVAAVLNTTDGTEMPAWLDGRDAPRPVACRNVLVDPMTGVTSQHTAAFFNGHCLDFVFDKDATCPTWLGFLESLWPDDPESRELLRQWFGYVLSGRTDLQKLMYLKGLPRSGKGTIARILTALLGSDNVIGPTFDSFGGGFGLELMVGAQLAVVGDARFTGDPKVMQSAISKILSITGEDRLNVDRKYKTTWSGTLPTRLMLLSNEMPWFRDSSSAIVDRMLLLVFKESFLGREDHTLEMRLRAELAGIFNWALEGYRELVIADGRFVKPAASVEVLEEFRETVSPIEAWLNEECEQTPQDQLISSGALYDRWSQWCTENGHRPGGVNGFLRMVQTVWPRVTRCPVLMLNAEGKRVKAWSGIRYTGPRE